MNEVLIFPAMKRSAEEAAQILLTESGHQREPVPSFNGFYVVRKSDLLEEKIIHDFELDDVMFAIVTI